MMRRINAVVEREPPKTNVSEVLDTLDIYRDYEPPLDDSRQERFHRNTRAKHGEWGVMRKKRCGKKNRNMSDRVRGVGREKNRDTEREGRVGLDIEEKEGERVGERREEQREIEGRWKKKGDGKGRPKQEKKQWNKKVKPTNKIIGKRNQSIEEQNNRHDSLKIMK